MERTGERTAVPSSDSHTGSPVSRQSTLRRSHTGTVSLLPSHTEVAEQEHKMSDNHNTTDTVSHAEEVLHGNHTEHRGHRGHGGQRREAFSQRRRRTKVSRESFSGSAGGGVCWETRTANSSREEATVAHRWTQNKKTTMDAALVEAHCNNSGDRNPPASSCQLL